MEILNEDDRISKWASFFICIMLASVGGFLEAFTYLLKGGVFCNAQTGNFAMLAIYFINKEWFYALMTTGAGKLVLSIVVGIIIYSVAGVIKVTKPVEYRR